MANAAVWLASASQRRGKWLKRHLAASAPNVRMVQMALLGDEDSQSQLTVRETVTAVSTAKLRNAFAELALGRIKHLEWDGPEPREAEIAVIVADTLVADPDAIGIALGKPVDELQAAAMLNRLSGRRHKVWSCTGIITHRSTVPEGWGGELSHDGWLGALWTESATVEIAELSEHALLGLMASESWRGKAGAYDLAGPMGEFAELIDGAEICVLGMADAAIRVLDELLDNSIKRVRGA